MRKLLAIDIGQVFELKNGVGIGSDPKYTQPGTLISVIVKNAYMAGGVIVLFLFLFGGLTYIINVSSGNSKKTAQGVKAISSALIGFLILFASYWIIQIVQAIFSVEILNPTL